MYVIFLVLFLKLWNHALIRMLIVMSIVLYSAPSRTPLYLTYLNTFYLYFLL